ncbi:MAG: polysaccharide deacetylase family protein [Clostridia bacterium]|nr:polysaccharide deacetylase family protein [Clostridia bacterium]
MSTFYRFPGGLHKAVTLSYDDGVEQDIRLMEILDQHGIKCTFNLNSGCWAPEGTVYAPGTIHRRMSKSQVEKVYANPNHEVAAHCLTHASLTELSPAEVAWEVLEDRRNLENMFGGLVRGLAYPFGTHSDRVVDALRATGVAYARTVVSTNDCSIPGDWLRLHPTCHHNAPNLMQLCDRFLQDSAPFGSRLFYLWGHSYEFEADNNWHVIEEFCDKMGGHEDIWYATNIQIVDYVNACRRVIASADGKTLYNPTSTDVWADVNGKAVFLPAGQTTRV